MASNLVATFQSRVIEPVREVYSRKIRMRRFPTKYGNDGIRLESGLALELMDDLNISHLYWPKPASLPTDGDQLAKSWQRRYARLLASQTSLSENSLYITFVDREGYLCLFWSSEKITDEPSETLPGVAQLCPGGSYEVFTRDSLAWVPNAQGLHYQIERNNHTNDPNGYLAEDGGKGYIKDSSFNVKPTPSTAWTVNDGASGTIFEDLGQSVYVPTFHNDVKATMTGFLGAASEEIYLTQGSMSMPASVKGRINIIHATVTLGPQTNGIVWWLQRADDSWYWNDSTPGWQSGRVANYFADTGAPWGDKVSDFSEIITTIASPDTWTFQVGLDDGGAPSWQAWCWHAQFVDLDYKTLPIVALDTATRFRAAPSRAWVLDAHSTETQRQLWFAKLGSGRVGYTPLAATADLPNSVYLVLLCGIIGTDPTEFDLLAYEKTSGGVGQFVFERHVGASTFKATVPHTLVSRTPVQLAGRVTDTDELDLRPKTISIFADGVRGTDSIADDAFDITDPHSEIWIGNAPPKVAGELTGTIRTACGYLFDVETLRRAVPDEAIQARR